MKDSVCLHARSTVQMFSLRSQVAETNSIFIVSGIYDWKPLHLNIAVHSAALTTG